MRHLISLKENSAAELLEILSIAEKLKKLGNAGKKIDLLKNQTLIMLFQKSSTRTRLSFEAAMTELGGHAIFLDAKTTQFSLTDFKDEIKAVMRYGSVLMFRAMKVADVELAAKQNQIPVIDACSEKYHPCQALGDLLTMSEVVGGSKKLKKIAWLGTENNVSNTLKLACAKLGVQVSLIAPEINQASVDQELNELAEKTGLITHTTDLETGLTDVQFIHTDTWMDMEFFDQGKVRAEFQTEYERRKKVLLPFQVNKKLLDTYCPQAKIMHCMPCHVGYEISRDAIDHPNSVIFDQAENRLHIQKAIIIWLLGLENLVCV